MDVAAFPAYGAALAAVTAAPGPLVAVVLTRSLGRDITGASAFAVGVCLGDLIAIGAIAAGIGTLLAGSAWSLAVLRGAGVIYLLWLAFQIWRDRHLGFRATSPATTWAGSVGAGAALCLGNPATFVFYMLMLPSVLPAGPEKFGSLLAVMVLSLAVIGSVLFVTILLAERLGRLIAAPGASARFSGLMALMIAGTAIWLMMA